MQIKPLKIFSIFLKTEGILGAIVIADSCPDRKFTLKLCYTCAGTTAPQNSSVF